MTFNKYNHQNAGSSRNGVLRKDLAVAALAIVLLLPHPSHGNSPLASIPTHHGINLDSLHLNERGGAVATRRRHWKQRYHPLPHSHSEFTAPSAKSVSTTSYSTLEPAEKIKKTAVKHGELEVTSPNKATTGSNQQGQQEGLSKTAITCMSLLALQFGIQPMLVRKYTPQTIVRSSVVLVQELVKFGIAGTIYFSGTKKETREKDLDGWSVKTWISLAGLPAFLYTIQNLAAVMAYQNLEALTFNVLNQTKILSAALSCYFVMGKRQSKMQVISLCILIVSTLVIEKILHPGVFASLLSMGGGGGTASALKGMTGAFSSLRSIASGAGMRFTHGIIPILVASLISGMAGALTQKNLQGSQGGASVWGKRRSTKSSPPASRPPRNAYLFSMEMNIASVILLMASLILSSDGRTILRSRTFFSSWTPETFIPVITNSIGGILVGLVTKHAGSVRKGFALIFGLLISGILQANGAGVGTHQVVGGLLAATSLWMHTVHPYKPLPAAEGDK
jgi:UDP-sugar transporter A1/2/3